MSKKWQNLPSKSFICIRKPKNALLLQRTCAQPLRASMSLSIPILQLLKTLVINLTQFSSSSIGKQNQQLDSKLTQLKIFCRNFSQNQAGLDVIANPEWAYARLGRCCPRLNPKFHQPDKESEMTLKHASLYCKHISCIHVKKMHLLMMKFCQT